MSSFWSSDNGVVERYENGIHIKTLGKEWTNIYFHGMHCGTVPNGKKKKVDISSRVLDVFEAAIEHRPVEIRLGIRGDNIFYLPERTLIVGVSIIHFFDVQHEGQAILFGNGQQLVEGPITPGYRKLVWTLDLSRHEKDGQESESYKMN